MIKKRISAYLTRTEELKALVCPADTRNATTAATGQYNPAANRTSVGEDRVLPKEFTVAGGSDGVGWE